MKLTKTLVFVLLAVAALIVLQGCISAPIVTPTNETNYTQQIQVFNRSWFGERPGAISTEKPWIIYAIITVFIMATVALLIYIIGYSFGIEQLKRYAESEMLQAVASAILIAFIVFFLYQILNILVVSFLGGPGAYARCGNTTISVVEPIDFAHCKAQEKIDRLDEMWNSVYASNEGMERWSSQCYMILGITFYCYDWTGSIRKQVGMAHTLGERIIGLEFILVLQAVMLKYIASNMLAYFLPVGLLLRILPPTRGIGGLFIAIAIGFFFVYPTLIFILDPSYMRPELTLPATFGSTDMAECYSGFRGAVALSTSSFLIDQGGLSLISYEVVGDRLSYIALEAIYIPFVALVITLIFVRTISTLFGAAPAHMMRLVSKFG